MTAPTPDSSSKAPNTVIGHPPGGPHLHHALAQAVAGHAEIVAAIVNHAELDQLKRENRRNEYDRAAVERGEVGGAGGGAASPAPGDVPG